jgi:FkbM family methyltransferase
VWPVPPWRSLATGAICSGLALALGSERIDSWWVLGSCATAFTIVVSSLGLLVERRGHSAMRLRRDHLRYRVLVGTAPWARTPFVGRVWEWTWGVVVARLDPADRIRMCLHGHEAIVNVGNPYPAAVRRWPTYNVPLVATIAELGRVLGRTVTLVDVGAAIGDTVLLVRERCAGMIDVIHCVEGDPEFLEILRANTSGFPEVRVHPEMVAEAVIEVPTLVRTHAGTASPQGTTTRGATTLDRVLECVDPIDVVKIDTDGYDGRVLAGASAILDDQRPVVLFEWHPKLCVATDTPWTLPFDVLLEHGYEVGVWFTKFGAVDRIRPLNDSDALSALAKLCLDDLGPAPDWHYDVVALPPGSLLDPTELAAAVADGRWSRGG